MKKECLIVIASFADGYLEELIKSIKENTTDVDYEIQVVDNHLDEKKIDTLVREVCKKYDVPFHYDTSITGYGDALNIGVEINNSDSKYVLYMDSDTLVSKGWLRKMINCYEKHKDEGCYMVGPLVKDFEDNYLPGVYELYGEPKDLIGNDLDLVNPYIIGVCILRERATISEFKWDKNFLKAYWEDNDLYAQVSYLGKKTFICGDSLMFHKVNSSHETLKSQGINPSMVGAKNKDYFSQKWDFINKKITKTNPNMVKYTSGEAFKIKNE